MTAGIPAPFTQPLGDQVVEGLTNAKSLKVIAEEMGLTRTTIHKWMRQHPLFASACMVARAEAAHVLIDESIEIADDKANDPQRARNMIIARQWAAERRNRRDYSQSVDLNVTERVDIGGALIEARKRGALPICNPATALADASTDYAELIDERATDNESVAPYNPFD